MRPRQRHRKREGEKERDRERERKRDREREREREKLGGINEFGNSDREMKILFGPPVKPKHDKAFHLLNRNG